MRGDIRHGESRAIRKSVHLSPYSGKGNEVAKVEHTAAGGARERCGGYKNVNTLYTEWSGYRRSSIPNGHGAIKRN
jgi:hypothetical protein